MSAHQCCNNAANGPVSGPFAARTVGKSAGPRRLSRRCLSVVLSIIPGVVLVLLPKCPACLAAYLALGTGVALSVSTASYLRLLLIALSVVSLSYVAARHLRRPIKLIFKDRLKLL